MMNMDIKECSIKALKLSLCYFLILLSGCDNGATAYDNNQEYEFAINVNNWWRIYPNGNENIAAFYALNQIIDGYAIFLRDNSLIAIPVSDFDGQLTDGQELYGSIDYIGKVGEKDVETAMGFTRPVEFFVKISKSEYLNALSRPKECKSKRSSSQSCGGVEYGSIKFP